MTLLSRIPYKRIDIITLFAYSLLCIITAIACFYILNHANWLFGDDSQFIHTTAVGKILPVFNYIVLDGRFNPLGLIDFNILVLFSHNNTALFHYCLSAISFIVFLIFSFLSFKKILSNQTTYSKYIIWLIVFCTLFLILRFLPLFLEIIFPERIIIVLFSLFLYLNLQFLSTEQWKYGISALIIAVYITYCKEPIFGALFVFSFTNLFWGFKQQSLKKKIFFSLLLLNSIIFISLYYFIVFQHATNFYHGGNRQMSYLELIKKALQCNKTLIIALGLFLFRLYRIIFKKDKDHLFYDSLLLAGISYAVALIILNLNFSYYYLPSVAMFFPALIYWGVYFFNIRLIIAVMLFSCLFCSKQAITYITDNQTRRNKDYSQISQIADFVRNGYSLVWFQTDLTSQPSSFDEKIRNWEKNTLNIYLQYILKESVQFNMETVANEVNIKKKSIVLYSQINNINSLGKEEFISLIKKKNMTYIQTTENIKIFKYE